MLVGSLVTVLPANAQHGPSWDREYLCRFHMAAGDNPRYLGSDDVGTIRNGLFRIDIIDINRTHRLALEYENFDNRVPSSLGLELPEEKLSFGLDHPFGNGYDLVMAGNMYSYNISDPYWAFGLYPCRSWDSGQPTVDKMGERQNKIAFGLERDNEQTTLAYAYSRFYRGNLGTLLGASHEKFVSHGGQTNRYDRAGGALLLTSPNGYWHCLFGAMYNFDLDKPSWATGFAKVSHRRDRGFNPGLLGVTWIKPELTYAMAIATIWGRGVNEDSSHGILTAGFRSAVNQSRLVRGRDFNQPGISPAYDAVDFGLISATATYIDAEMMGTNMVSWEYALYGTMPKNTGFPIRPYLSFAYTGETDLIFNYRTFSLDNPDQQWYVISLGGKLHLMDRVDPYNRYQYGFLRLETSLKFNEDDWGVFLKTTYWL